MVERLKGMESGIGLTGVVFGSWLQHLSQTLLSIFGFPFGFLASIWVWRDLKLNPKAKEEKNSPPQYRRRL